MERILGPSSEYVQSNGHWTRITEPVSGRLSDKPPIYDINAHDLYIPFMALGTYVVLAGLLLGLQGKQIYPGSFELAVRQGLGRLVLASYPSESNIVYIG
ncbi:Hypothetical predicted protein [Olea europaea subsp. europaea]|uniref:Uncharacterized protein n=1 Tax=Olea europaea subsp. europaea TaxID=158383 RepID=A0A8S0PWG3_OLEEU|nr:Hypothetical predicted protein [Olea europaea subsp. europaea]